MTPTFTINGRRFWNSRLAELHLVAAGKYAGRLTSGISFTIEGGRALGGSRRDWFLDIEGSTGAIICTSVRDALNVICNA